MKEARQGLEGGLGRHAPAILRSSGQAADEAATAATAEARSPPGTFEELGRNAERRTRAVARKIGSDERDPATEEGRRDVCRVPFGNEGIETGLRTDAEAAARIPETLVQGVRSLPGSAEALLVRQRDPAGIFVLRTGLDDHVESRSAGRRSKTLEAVANARDALAVGRSDDEARLPGLQPRRPEPTRMTVQPIRSAQNHRVKGIRRLRARQGAARAESEGLLLLEGRHLVEAALDAKLDIVEALATVDFAEGHAELLERLPAAALQWIEPSLLAASADSDAPQGLVAVAHRPAANLSACPQTGLLLYLDGLQDPGNVGALARSAEAFGAAALVLAPGSAHWRHPRALRGSAGSLLRLPCFHGVDADTLDALLERRPTWWVLSRDGDAALEDVALDSAAVLVVGNEAHGPRHVLQTSSLAERRRLVSIPIAGAVESLNAAVAGSIALHALRSSHG